MKKMILILCIILLSSCAQDENSNEGFDELAQSVDFNATVASYGSDRGFYPIEIGLFFLDKSILKFYSFDSKDILDLSSLSYCDDKTISGNDTCVNNNENLQSFSMIQVYDSHIYYPTEHYDIKNGFSYVLNRVDLIGKNQEAAYTFDNYIYGFLIHRGKLVYLRSDNSSITIVDLDSQHKDLYFENPVGYISRITAFGDYIYFVANDNTREGKHEDIYSFNINTQEMKVETSISNIDFPLITDEYISESEFYPISNSNGENSNFTYYESYLISRETNERVDLGSNRELIHMDNTYYYFTNKAFVYLNPEATLEFTITDHEFNILKKIKIPNSSYDDYLTVVNDKYVVLYRSYVISNEFLLEYYICDYWSDNPEFIKISE